MSQFCAKHVLGTKWGISKNGGNMDQATWLQMSANTGQSIRSAQFNYSLGTTAGLAILVFGDTADFKLPVAVAIIAMAIYGLLVPISGMQNWKILIGDMPESMGSTASGAATKKAPVGMYIIVTAVLTIAAAAAQLSVLY